MLLMEFNRKTRRALEENRSTGNGGYLQWWKFGRRNIRRRDFSIQQQNNIDTYKIRSIHIRKSIEIYIYITLDCFTSYTKILIVF